MPEPDPGGTISLGGLTFRRVPRWVMIGILGVLLAAGICAGWWKYVENPQAEIQLQIAQTAVNEYGRHMAESPEVTAVLLDDKRGKITAASYPDLCLFLAFSHNGRVHTKLIPSLERGSETHQMARVDLDAQAFAALDFLVHPVLAAPASGSGPRCLNPHPGPFQTWYGERGQGCWVRVHRRWPHDPGRGHYGVCEHWQWYEGCRGIWDEVQPGVARVTWVACAH